MKKIILTLKKEPALPIEAETITPENFAGRTLDEIKKLIVWRGKRKEELGDYFKVEGEKSEEVSETHIILKGDLSKVKYIGKQMATGKITVKGNAGMHLADEMRGGEIVVEGNVSDWSATEFRNGILWIKGNVGNMFASAYPGNPRGMRGGIIVIEGKAGNSLARKMRRGTIIVYDSVGDNLAAQMIAGTVISLGNIGNRPGMLMKRGTIICFGKIQEMLPTFIYDNTYSPLFIRYYFKELREKLNIRVPVKVEGLYERYHGDVSELGKGEIFIYKG